MLLYIAKLTFRIICGDGAHTPQFDEQLRLIHAPGPGHALQKAIHVGENSQETFLNNQGELVKWQFINVVDLYTLDSVGDGNEICSNVHEVTHPENHIKLINNKADLLRSRYFKGLIEKA